MSELNDPSTATAKAAQAIGHRVDLASSLRMTTLTPNWHFSSS
jgi:hypothetical protein